MLTGALLVDALSSQYQFESEIGQGGMATVYRAQDLRDGKLVAIKVLRPEFASASLAERFLREIRITSTLRHANILSPLDSGVVADCPWYAMPLIDGSLRQQLERSGGQLPLPEIIQVSRQIASALDHAHSLGVIHRDIKPENILLSGDKVWVADFGIARIPLSEGDVPLTSGSVAMGTPNYMSPEQGRGGLAPLDGRSDVYSLGCVIYELLAGAPPFAGGTREAILARHALDPVPPVQTVRPTVSTAADAVLRTMMAKSPADRFATATEAVDALEAALGKRDTSGRRRAIAVGLGVAGVALLALMAVLVDPEPLDAHRILVVPFENRGSLTLDGEDIATAVADAFNTTDSLIAIVADAGDSTLKAPWPDSLVARLGRTRNARYVVTGRVSPDASPRIEVEIKDLVGGSVMFRDVAVAGANDAFSIAREVARKLLPDVMRPGGALVDVNLLSADLPALAAYLEGERAYRRGDYRRADSLFGFAVMRDSTFAWAALRGAQAANWLTERGRAGRYLEVTFRKLDSLPPRYAFFARGLAAYGKGEADSAVAFFQRALTFDPRWAEAHHALGETYHHYLPRTGYPLETAAAEFDSALAHDPSFTAPLFHATQHAIWKDDRARADSLYRRFSAVAPDSGGERLQLELMLGCIDGESTAARWKAAVARSMNTAAQAATWLVVGGLRHPRCAIDALEAIVADTAGQWTWRYYATLELASVQAALGNTAEVRRLLQDVGSTADAMTVFLASSGVPIDDLADSAGLRLRQQSDSLNGDLGNWAAGVWMLSQGDSVGAQSMLRALAKLATNRDARRARLLHESLSARLTLARGDTGAALDLLQRLVPDADQATLRWSPFEAFPWERLRLAELLAALGRPNQAAQAAAAFDSPASFGFVPWLPAILKFRERLERSLGDAPYADALGRRSARLTPRSSSR